MQMATKRKASAPPPSDNPNPAATGTQRKKSIPFHRSSNIRTHTIYRVISQDGHDSGSDDEEETPNSKLIGTYFNLTEANKKAYNQIGSRRDYESYTREFDDDGLVTASGVYVTTGHSFRVARAKVLKESIPIPELLTVLKRAANEDMKPGEISLVGTFIRYDDAEKATQKEISAYQARVEAGRKRAETEGNTLEFDVFHKKGDGKSVFSKGMVEFTDLREAFPVVWVERSALEIGPKAADDENDWSDDDD